MKIISKKINCFEEYETIIQDFCNQVNNKSRRVDKDYIPVFRGVRELGTRYLSPSLSWKNLVKYEYDMIYEMKRFKPLEFNTLSGLDLLGKCRHYNLPSRLLDFSLSHYVALFFAVTKANLSDNLQHKSKVYCISANVRNEASAEDISCISMRLQPAMYGESGNETCIENILNFNTDDKDRVIRNFINKTLTSPLFVYPKFYTIREQNQQSIFMIFPNRVFDNNENEDITEKIRSESFRRLDKSCVGRFKFLPKLFNPILESPEDRDDLMWEIEIAESAVDLIKERLNSLGIDEAFLFPDNLEYTANKIEKKYLEKVANINKTK